MKPVQPFATRDELQAAVDNGGRFYHLFSHAGDQEISTGELAKAAGVFCNVRSSFLFLELACRDLPASDHSEIVAMLEPKLRDRFAELRPATLTPSDVERRGAAGETAVITGWPTFTREKLDTMMIPMMVGTVLTMIPMQQKFRVYEVFDDESRSGSSTFATMPIDSEILEETPTRFAGFLRDLDTTDDGGSEHKFYLETIFYTDLPQ